MEIGIGLPNTIPGTAGRTLVAWARRAEERGFRSLGTIDRVAYPNYDSLIALAAAAAATERIKLMTDVLLGPTRNPVLLAKTAASVDQVSRRQPPGGAGPADHILAMGLNHLTAQRLVRTGRYHPWNGSAYRPRNGHQAHSEAVPTCYTEPSPPAPAECAA